MKQNSYIADILSQPQALNVALDHYQPGALNPLVEQIRAGKFDRIVLTGMGASYYGLYPAYLEMVRLGLPVWLVETSELLHYGMGQITAGSLLWITSQSGYSVEVQALLDRLDPQPAYLLAVTNDPDSPLGQRADSVLEIRSGAEFTVSTRSYLNTLAVSGLAVREIAGGGAVEAGLADLRLTLTLLEESLGSFPEQVERLAAALGVPERLVILGRGPALATAEIGALIQKEAAKFQVEGLSAAQFRHGPLELADASLTALVLEGDEPTRGMMAAMADDLFGYKARVHWIATRPHALIPTILIPDAPTIGRRILEIVPFQALTVALATQTGVDPGMFRYIGKVTLTE